MIDKKLFERIQPYSDKDVPKIIDELVKERGFLGFAKIFFPELSTRQLIHMFKEFKTIRDFQV